jgi:hypothetical protein
MRPANGSRRVPPAVAFLVVVGVFAAGVLIGGVPGAVILGALAALVAVLLATTWARLRPAERAIRVVVLLVLVAVAISVVQ